jgi:hypothetical protein
MLTQHGVSKDPKFFSKPPTGCQPRYNTLLSSSHSNARGYRTHSSKPTEIPFKSNSERKNFSPKLYLTDGTAVNPFAELKRQATMGLALRLPADNNQSVQSEMSEQDLPGRL